MFNPLPERQKHTGGVRYMYHIHPLVNFLVEEKGDENRGPEIETCLMKDHIFNRSIE